MYWILILYIDNILVTKKRHKKIMLCLIVTGYVTNIFAKRLFLTHYA